MPSNDGNLPREENTGKRNTRPKSSAAMQKSEIVERGTSAVFSELHERKKGDWRTGKSF